MATTIGSYPVVTLTLQSAATLPAHRFATNAGVLPAAGASAFGVTRAAAVAGDLVACDTVGTTIVEAGGVIAIGGPVKTDAAGKAIAQGGTGSILGRALTASAADGDLIHVLLIANA